MSRKKLPAISSEGPTGDKAPRTIEYKVGSIDASGVREDRLVPVQLMVTKTTHTKVAAPPKHPATIDLEPADQSRPPTEMEAPVPSARQLRCSECGEIAEAACDCGAPYLPAGARAAEAIAKHPEKSDRAIAAEPASIEGRLSGHANNWCTVHQLQSSASARTANGAEFRPSHPNPNSGPRPAMARSRSWPPCRLTSARIPSLNVVRMDGGRQPPAPQTDHQSTIVGGIEFRNSEIPAPSR
jgi:hypothetical protein